MSNYEYIAADRRAEPIVLVDPAQGINRTLVMRPKHFFSNEFHLEVVDDGPGFSLGKYLAAKLRAVVSIGLKRAHALFALPLRKLAVGG